MWAPAYATVEQAKSYMRIGDNADDVLIGMWVEASSRAVDDWCGRQFGQVDALEARTYVTRYDRQIGSYAEVDDVMDLTGATVLCNGLAVASPLFGPANAAARGRPYTRLTGSSGVLTVTARWGWSDVPGSVTAATLLQTSRLAARRDAPFGIAGSPESGSEMRLLARLDPDVQVLLGQRYRRTVWAS